MNAAKTHLSLTVRDVEKSAAWYEEFFGRPAHKRRSGYANFDLDAPALKLALQQGTTEGRGPLNHLGILMESSDEVVRERDRLVLAGMAIADEEDTVCCHARQAKFWVSDPDGNAWEVYTILDDMQDQSSQANACDPASQCCGAMQAT